MLSRHTAAGRYVSDSHHPTAWFNNAELWQLSPYTIYHLLSAKRSPRHPHNFWPSWKISRPSQVHWAQSPRQTTYITHTHITFSDTQKVPKKWNELLQCRECKRNLVTYLGDCFLCQAPALLQGNQKMYVSGSHEGPKADKAYYATPLSTYNEEPNLESNAEEADTRVWLHVVKSSGRRVMIYSPDTDVLHIGLLVANTITKDIRIQTSPLGKPRKVLSLNAIVDALNRDPDLATIAPEERTKVMVSLYTITACDFTSFFVGHGKATFLQTFFKYANFISGESPNLPGSLADVHDQACFLSFQLVGMVYYKKFRTASIKHNSPVTMLHSFLKGREVIPANAFWLDQHTLQSNMGVSGFWRQPHSICWCFVSSLPTSHVGYPLLEAVNKHPSLYHQLKIMAGRRAVVQYPLIGTLMKTSKPLKTVLAFYWKAANVRKHSVQTTGAVALNPTNHVAPDVHVQIVPT